MGDGIKMKDGDVIVCKFPLSLGRFADPYE